MGKCFLIVETESFQWRKIRKKEATSQRKATTERAERMRGAPAIMRRSPGVGNISRMANSSTSVRRAEGEREREREREKATRKSV